MTENAVVAPQTNPDQVRKEELLKFGGKTYRIRGILIGFAFFWIPTLLLGYAGWWLGGQISQGEKEFLLPLSIPWVDSPFQWFSLGLAGTALQWISLVGTASLWIASYITLGFRIIPQQQFIVVERLGRVYKVHRAGMHVLCLPGIIDKVSKEHVNPGTYTYQSIRLYDGNGAEEAMDFLDGSSGVVGEAFYRVQQGREVSFAYELEDPKERLETLLDDAIRTFFQNLTIQQALTNKNLVWDAVRGRVVSPAHTEKKDSESLRVKQEGLYTEIQRELEQAGLELDNIKGIIISDIRLTPSLVRLRELKLEGEQEGLRQAMLGQGMAKTLQAVANSEVGKGLSPQEVVAFVNEQKYYEVMAETTANVSHFNLGRGVKNIFAGNSGN